MDKIENLEGPRLINHVGRRLTPYTPPSLEKSPFILLFKYYLIFIYFKIENVGPGYVKTRMPLMKSRNYMIQPKLPDPPNLSRVKPGSS